MESEATKYQLSKAAVRYATTKVRFIRTADLSTLECYGIASMPAMTGCIAAFEIATRGRFGPEADRVICVGIELI